ncbi:Hypothetical predicted protein [Octopus vulgaris]|uniref:Uncharacterized protein n=1 Tax=Octopus vulgaris TaxID=6645 RepID=A0AA36BLB2_OCTVU|nr:Hypothetical predicted protein [Octopus vulgaris]
MSYFNESNYEGVMMEESCGKLAEKTCEYPARMFNNINYEQNFCSTFLDFSPCLMGISIICDEFYKSFFYEKCLVLRYQRIAMCGHKGTVALMEEKKACLYIKVNSCNKFFDFFKYHKCKELLDLTPYINRCCSNDE